METWAEPRVMDREVSLSNEIMDNQSPNLPYLARAPCLKSTAERASLAALGGEFFDKLPVDFETEAGLVADDQLAVMQVRVLLEQAVMQRVGVGPAMRLDPE
jgi:hypothetical protein